MKVFLLILSDCA